MREKLSNTAPQILSRTRATLLAAVSVLLVYSSFRIAALNYYKQFRSCSVRHLSTSYKSCKLLYLLPLNNSNKMPPSSAKTSIIIFLLQTIHFGLIYSARTRLRNTLDVKFNLDCHLPQCNSLDTNKSAVNLFQVVSSNQESPDKTNFIWSNIGGPPMVITTSSSQESSLIIDWEAILNDKKPANNETSGFHFNVTQDASIGLLVEKIILFDDTDKSGLFTKEKPHIEIDWADIIWDLASRTTYQKDDFLKTTLRMRSKHQYLNGNLLVKLAIPRDYKADRQREGPHLKLNNQSISIVIVVDGIQPPPGFKNTRLTMTFVVVVQSPTGAVSVLPPDSESLISDEFTPGVFRIKSLQFKAEQDPNAEISTTTSTEVTGNFDIYAGTDGEITTQSPSLNPRLIPSMPSDRLGFLYWKEIAYTDRRKIMSRTVDVYDGERSMDMSTLPNISQPFYQFYNYKPKSGHMPRYILYRLDFIFGKSDTTYSSTNFTDFSFVFGLGSAPQEQMFSVLVKIIIFVCFCLPIFVMLAGLGYLMLRRFRRNGDTELLLAAES